MSLMTMPTCLPVAGAMPLMIGGRWVVDSLLDWLLYSVANGYLYSVVYPANSLASSESVQCNCSLARVIHYNVASLCAKATRST